MVDFLPLTPTNGNLIGLCSTCDTWMYRRATKSKLATVAGDLKVQFVEGQPHIGESSYPSVNSDFKRSDRP